MKYFLFIIVFTFFCIKANAQLALDLEGGACQFGYNDVRISGKEGSLFSLSDDFKSKVSPYCRSRINYTINGRHVISGLFAPLNIKSSGTLSTDIYFENKVFTSGLATSYIWKFNSYRLSYQYNFILREWFTFGLGLTAKVRDAKIALNNGVTSAEKTNLGVVPLVRFYADWRFAAKLHLIADGDALVGTQGRAEDVLLAIGYQPTERLIIKVGYRLLEGGADNDKVYNFSAVHYASLSATWTFIKQLQK